MISLELCMKIHSQSVPTIPKSNYLELLVEHDLIVVYRFYSITFWTYVFVIKMAVNCLYVCGTLICQHLITLITLPTSVSFCQMYRCWQIYCRIANIYTYHLYLLLSDPTLYIKFNSILKLLTEV